MSSRRMTTDEERKDGWIRFMLNIMNPPVQLADNGRANEPGTDPSLFQQLVWFQ